MSEIDKKLSLLSRLDSIIDDNYVNNDVYQYEFSTIQTVILNSVCIDTKEYNVRIILYLDELIIELLKDDKVQMSYALPYPFVDNLHLLEEEKE